MTSLRFRLFWPVTLISLGLVALCAFTAVSLLRQQADLAVALRENLASRRAATELEECLLDLIALLKDRVESVATLHDRLGNHLAHIRQTSDQAEEVAIAERLDEGFRHYLARWQSLPSRKQPDHDDAVKDMAKLLEVEMLQPCQDLELYNGRRIEESAEQHDWVQRQLSWGLVGVGALAGVAGLVLGFGVARGLSHSIRRLQIQVRDAAGKLAPEQPEIVLTGEGDFRGLQEQIGELTGRIEKVVQELHQREREVLRAEQLAAVGQLAAGVAHEIRNPLTSIKMLVQAVLEEDDVVGMTADELRVIEHEIRRLEKSLQTFLDFARPPRAERRPVDVVGVARNVLDLTRGRLEKQRVTVKFDVPAESLTLTADGSQLEQVLVNLVLNALDVMPSGGTLSLGVRRSPGGAVEVEVADTGPGIAAELMPRLFQPFVSSKVTGLGLGLVISRRIIEDHGGTLTAANRPGGGASFTTSLPGA